MFLNYITYYDMWYNDLDRLSTITSGIMKCPQVNDLISLLVNWVIDWLHGDLLRTWLMCTPFRTSFVRICSHNANHHCHLHRSDMDLSIDGIISRKNQSFERYRGSTSCNALADRDNAGLLTSVSSTVSLEALYCCREGKGKGKLKGKCQDRRIITASMMMTYSSCLKNLDPCVVLMYIMTTVAAPWG